jgi:hypothetical protein
MYASSCTAGRGGILSNTLRFFARPSWPVISVSRSASYLVLSHTILVGYGSHLAAHFLRSNLRSASSLFKRYFILFGPCLMGITIARNITKAKQTHRKMIVFVFILFEHITKFVLRPQFVQTFRCASSKKTLYSFNQFTKSSLLPHDYMICRHV